MGGVGGAVCVDREVCVAVVCSEEHHVILGNSFFHNLANQFIYAFYSLGD